MDNPGAAEGREGNVLEFRPRDPNAPPIVVKPTDYDGCVHCRFTLVIDEQLRTVECSKCKVVLDPVWCLMEWAGIYRDTDIDYKEMKKRVKRLEALERRIGQQADRARMTDEELKMDFYELRAKHSVEGCPKERMWFDRRGMINCYCGYGMNAQFYPKLAEEVHEAHARVRLRTSLSVTGASPPNPNPPPPAAKD